MGQMRRRMAAGLAATAAIATAATIAVPPATAARATTAKGLTVRVTGAYRHTFHLASCTVSPPQKGNPTVTWGVVEHLHSEQNLFGLVQSASNSPIGRINLRTTDDYVATFEHGGKVWQAGFTNPGHLGSGTATVTQHVVSGRVSATLIAPNEHVAPVHVTAAWRCQG